MKRRVINKEEKHREENRRNEDPRIAAREAKKSGNDSQEAARSTNQKVSVVTLTSEPIRNPTASECPSRASQQNHYAQGDAGRRIGHPFLAFEEDDGTRTEGAENECQ